MSPAVAQQVGPSAGGGLGGGLGSLLNKVGKNAGGFMGAGGSPSSNSSSQWDTYRGQNGGSGAGGANVKHQDVQSNLAVPTNRSDSSFSSTRPSDEPLEASYTRAFPPPLEPRHYTVLKEVGDGSFGTVWLVDWHSPLHLPPGTRPPGPSSRAEYKGKQLVAVKRMKKAFEGWEECMKLKELKSLRQIAMHPNIIPLYDAFLLPSTRELYFVFECMEGNLYQLTKSRRGRPLAAGLTASIFYQILAGLDHIHRSGYFHRDMKPENLLITTTGLADYPASSLYALPGTPPEKDVVVVVKLADFGLAREINSRPPYTEYVSTRWYRAPEVLLRSRDYSVPVDMWALGTIMVEAITLKPLFPGDSEVDQIHQICQLLGNPSAEHGVDDRGRTRGGGPWVKGAKMAKDVGFEFPKMSPRSWTAFFDMNVVSIEFIDCIADLLRFEPSARPTALECLNAPYFRNVAPRFSPLPAGVDRSLSTHGAPNPTSFGATRDLPPAHNHGTPNQYKPPFQPNEEVASGAFGNRHLSLDSAYSIQIQARGQHFDSPMLVFPEDAAEHPNQFTSPTPSSVWSGQHVDPNWGRNPQPYEQHPGFMQPQGQAGYQRPIPAFGSHGRRSSFGSSVAPSIAASTFYDGSIFEGIAPSRADSIMSFPTTQSAFGGYPASFTSDSPALIGGRSSHRAPPAIIVGSERNDRQHAGQIQQPQASTSKKWGFFGSEKNTAPAPPPSIQASQPNPLKRTPSTASAQFPPEGYTTKPPLDPKKAKKEAEKAAKEAEKLKREMAQVASRERARAVMKKKSQLMEAADPLNFSNHTRTIQVDKGKARASERPVNGASSRGARHSDMPQIVEDTSKLHVSNDSRFKMRRRDDDDDVHSVSSSETGASSQRGGRPFSIASKATSASDPEQRRSPWGGDISRAPSLSSGHASSQYYSNGPPSTGQSAQDLATREYTHFATGTQRTVGPDLRREILFLADSLSASEALCAAYVHSSVDGKRWSGHGAQSGLELYLSERAEKLQCLQALWRGAMWTDARFDQSPFKKIFLKETQELVGRGHAAVVLDPTSNSKGSWTSKIIYTIDKLKETTASLRQSLNNPGARLAVTTAKQGTAVSDDLTLVRLQAHEYERQALSQLLFLIATAQQLELPEILNLTQQLGRTSLEDGVSVYLLVAVLAALDSCDPAANLLQKSLPPNGNFISSMKSRILDDPWTSRNLQSAVLLQWTILLERSASANNIHLDQTAHGVPGVSQGSSTIVDSLTEKAITGDLFAFLARGVISFKRDPTLDDGWAAMGAGLHKMGGIYGVSPSFEIEIMEQIELLVFEVVKNRMKVLRRILQREEDVLPNSHRGGGGRTSHGGVERARGHVIESLFLLIATLYRDRPDSDGGLTYWMDGDAPRTAGGRSARSFIRWSSDCTAVTRMTSAYHEMVTSLATGPRSAACAFQFLSEGGPTTSHGTASPTSSWPSLFKALVYYCKAVGSQEFQGSALELPPDEVVLLRSFVRLLRQVVQYCDSAREDLYDNQQYRPVATCFGLLVLPLPIELKADLLGAVAAFARPGGVAGVSIARRTWEQLEKSGIVLDLADRRLGGTGAVPRQSGSIQTTGRPTVGGGVVVELEQVEAPNGSFPESTALVKLLNTLIHPSSPLEPIRMGIDFDTHTIPVGLGAGTRAPGIDPYVHFVLDEVLLKTGTRDYVLPSARWEVTDAALLFVERCLNDYDLGAFLSTLDPRDANATPSFHFTEVVNHPGFDILTRILSASKLLETIFTILVAGHDAISGNSAGTPLFATCVLRCLRILRRTLDLQTHFLESLLPALVQSKIPIPEDKRSRLVSLAPVDRSLLFQSEAVVQIALLVNCAGEDEIGLLAVQILTTLASSTFFNVEQRFPEQARGRLNRLVGIIQASIETERVLLGFSERLDADVYESDLEVGESNGEDGTEGSKPQAIRSAILDLLLRTTQAEAVGPTIGHLLLGFSVDSLPSELEIERPEVGRTSLHIVLELLQANVAGTQEETSVRKVPPTNRATLMTSLLFQYSSLARHPTFAAKCYRLVHQLCVHKYTSTAVSRYLRSHENFYSRQGSFLPFTIPTAMKGPLGSVRYTEAQQIVTSSAAVCATLEAQAWLLESIALEINALALGNDKQRLLQLVNVLFLPAGATNEDAPRERDIEQSLPRIREVFHAFDFVWYDSINPAVPSEAWRTIDFDSCLRLDSNVGCELYDIDGLVGLIASTRRDLQDRGGLNTLEQRNAVKKETRAIIETAVVENHKREIMSARLHALRAWKALLGIAYDKAFHLFRSPGRYLRAMDIILAMLDPIAGADTDPTISELLSEAVVLLVAKVRDGGAQIEAVKATDQLHFILRGIIVGIVQPNVSLIVRGNLYVAFVDYFTLTGLVAESSSLMARTYQADDSMTNMSDSVDPFQQSVRRNTIDKGNVAVFLSALDRLLPIICRDAAAGTSVWRGVAFSALDTVVMVAQETRSTSKLLSILSKHGYLQSFIASLKEAEEELMKALDPDPESLSAFYIFTSQMAFLIRLASTREGAEKLLDANLLGRLSECEYLGARPEDDASMTDFDGFVPPSAERHHELLLPALQLVIASLVAFGSQSPMATQQAMTFVNGQRDTMVVSLRNAATNPTGPSLREAHLIVTLLGIVLPTVSVESLVRHPHHFEGSCSQNDSHPEKLDILRWPSFGGASCVRQNLWLTRLDLPNQPDYRIRAARSRNLCHRSVAAISFATLLTKISSLGLGGQETLFSQKTMQLSESLEGTILTYHSIATRKQNGGVFRPVWLPSAQESASAPYLGAASSFVRDLAQNLSARLEEAAKLSDLLDPAQTLDDREEVSPTAQYRLLCCLTEAQSTTAKLKHRREI
ncbi:hypothetical protein P7C70_g3143, partial [Phenoliferia sp. Uapishka_3]